MVQAVGLVGLDRECTLERSLRPRPVVLPHHLEVAQRGMSRRQPGLEFDCLVDESAHPRVGIGRVGVAALA